MLISLCLLASAPLQQSIEREVTYVATETASAQVARGFGDSFTVSSVSVAPRVDFDIPTGNRVALREVYVEAQVSGRLEYGATGTSSSGTRILGQVTDGAAFCSGQCRWGPMDFSSAGYSLDSSVLLGQGERFTGVEGLAICQGPSCEAGITYTETSFQWPDVLQDPSFVAQVGISSVTLTGLDQNGDASSFQLDALTSEVSATSIVTTLIELDAAPLTEYCTSPVGSTGVDATLAAFGSQQEGTEYLTVVAENLPAASFSILFLGSSPANTPMGGFNLCVGAPQRQGGIQATGDDGVAEFNIELSTQAAGDTVYMQAIFRDATLGAAATNASSFVVQQG